jgi:hypothetical protein
MEDWRQISCEDVLACLESLRQLILAPPNGEAPME